MIKYKFINIGTRSQEKIFNGEFIFLYNKIKSFWKNIEVKNEESPFNKNIKIETYVKYSYPKSRKNILNIIKSYKHSILKNGTCYYTQESLARFHKIKQQRVSEAQKSIEKIFNTRFILIPTKIINSNFNQNSPSIKILIPPGMYNWFKRWLKRKKYIIDNRGNIKTLGVYTVQGGSIHGSRG